MADIRCPNCGKTNPESNLLCDYCNALLQPEDVLPPESGDDLMSLLGQESDEDVPDWLQELSPEEEGLEAPQEEVPVESAAAEDTPLDFLASEPAPEQTSVESQDGEDWLASLGDIATPAEQPAAEEPPAFIDPGEELEAWLSRKPEDEAAWDLEQSGDADAAEAQAADEVVSASALDETLDWLSSLDQVTEQPQAEETPDVFGATPAESPPSGEGDLDWLDNLPGIEDSLSAAGETEDDQPGWLSSLDSEDFSLEDQPGSQASESQLSAEEPVDETLDFSFAETPSLDETEDVEISLEPQVEDSTLDMEAEPPDWLADLGDAGFVATEEAEAFAVPAEDGFPEQEQEDLPDWFSQTLSQAPAEDGAAQPDEAGQPSAVSPFTSDEIEDLEGTGETPDWFNGLQEEPETSDETLHPAEDLPDWLQEVGEGESPFGAVADSQEQPADELASQPSDLEGAGAQTDMPGWLGEIEPLSDQEIPADEEVGAVNFASMSMQEEESVPDWLANLDMDGTQAEGEGTPAFTSEEGLPPFDVDASTGIEAPSELQPQPDWLDQITSQDLPPVEAARGVAEDTGLEPAELPGWLEAMRPGEASAGGLYQDTSDSRTESAGLLSGLPGILPGAYEPSRGLKPPVYTVKLHISQDQQDRVDLLKEMMEDEVRDILPSSPLAIPTTYILRLLILGAFILGAIFAFVAGVQQTPVPGAGSIPAELLDLRHTLDDLPNGVPVLVAFDYQVATLPEMETAALPVFDQLILKGSLIRAVSTNNSGPLLAQHMLERAASMPDRQQLAPTDFANLGFIPGGAAGLQAFERDPAEVMRYDLAGTESGSLDAWQMPAFDPAAGMSNFQLVLVITDNADTARSWVEQVGPGLQENDIPLLMVLSTQAEPMVRPYYTSVPQQVAGFATGLMGGVFLESLSGRAGPARLYLDAYSLTLMVAVILLVIGSLVNLVSGQVSTSKQTKSEGKAK